MKITSFSLLCEWLYQERAWVRQCAVTLAEEYASHRGAWQRVVQTGPLYSALDQHGFTPTPMLAAVDDGGPQGIGEHFDRLAQSGFEVLLFTIPLFGLGQGLMGYRNTTVVAEFGGLYYNNRGTYGRLERLYDPAQVSSAHPAWCYGRDGMRLSEELRGQLSLDSAWWEYCDAFHREWVYLRESLRLVKHLSEGGRKMPESVVGYLCSKCPDGSFIRPSTEDPTQWVFTASEAHGAADRQTRMRPGKLLRRLLPDEPEVVIQAVSTAYTQGTALYEVRFADTREEIRRVYEEGPNSCMSKCADAYETWGDIHPSEVYAGPDTKLAYIQDFSGNITARAIVVPSKKAWVRMYGNSAGLEPALRTLGYGQDSEALEGCRLLLLKRGSEVICPYLDGDYGRVTESDGYLVIGDSGAEAGAHGTVNLNDYGEDDENSRCCDNCGDYENYEDGEHLLGGDSETWICRGCLYHSDSVRHGYINTRGGTGYMWSEVAVWVDVLDTYVRESVINSSTGRVALDIVWSDHVDDYILLSEAVCLADGSYVHKDDGARCAVSGEYYSLDEYLKLWDGARGVYDELLDTEDVAELGSLSACPLGIALADEVEVFEAPDGQYSTMLKAEMVELDGVFYRMRDLTPVVDGNNLSWTINSPEALRFTRPVEVSKIEVEIEEAIAA